MRALVLGPSGPALRTVPSPSRPGEATIRVRLAGVCATDLELVRGYMGFEGVLGHEFVGEVIDAPDRAWVGQRVVGDINAACGACPTCRAGRPHHCPTRTVLGILGRDGCFAETTSLPLANLHPVPDAVSDEAAVFVEPLAAALRIVEQVHVKPTDRVLVLGLGRLGQLCARVLALTGADVVGVGSPARAALLPRSIPAVRREHAASLAGADVVVDCTGSPDGLGLAKQLVRAQGTIVLKTTVHDLGDAQPAAWVVDEVTIVGSRCGPFAPALRALARGLVDPTPLISARRPLSDGVALLDLAAKSVKVLVAP